MIVAIGILISFMEFIRLHNLTLIERNIQHHDILGVHRLKPKRNWKKILMRRLGLNV